MKKLIIALLCLSSFAVANLRGDIFRTVNIWNHVAGTSCKIIWAGDSDPNNLRYLLLVPTPNQATQVMLKNGHFLIFDCMANNNASSQAAIGIPDAGSQSIVINVNGDANKLSLVESH